MSTARKILSNTLAQILGKVGVAMLGLAVVKIATNYLSVAGYGEYIVIYEFLAFFGIAADLGLYTIAVRDMAEDESKIPKIIGNVLSIRTILVTITMIAAAIAVFFIPKYAGTRIPIGVIFATLTVWATILNGTITSVLQVKLKMGIASVAVVLGKFISVGFMVYVIFFGFPNDKEMGFYMLIAAGNIGALVNLLATSYWVRKIAPIKYQFDLSLWKEIMKKSLPYGVALILSTIYFRMNSIFISLMRGQEEVGIYAVAMRMLEQLTIVPLYFMNSVLPVLTKAIKENTDRYKKIISYSFDFLASLSVPLVVGGVLLAYPIIFIVSSPEYLSRLPEGFYGSDIAFQILVVALLFQFLNILSNFILIALNKQAKLLYINGGVVIIDIILNLIFIPKYGFQGACVTAVFSELFILVASMATSRHYLKFSINFMNLFKIIISALVMGAIIKLLQPITYQYLQNWNVLLLVAIGSVVYFAMLFVTKVISKDMLKLLKKEAPEPEEINYEV